MLKRNWGILLTLGIAAIGSPLLYVALEPGQPNLPSYEHAERGNPNYQPGGSRCQPPILATIRDRREAASERERCAKETEDHDLQSHDLIQQARAADAAQAQATLGYQMAWMGVYGTIGGFLTLLAAAAAAFYARDAARAGNASLSHEKGVSHSELRPWIQISLEPHSGFNDPEDAKLFCLATLKNLGRTPAQAIKVGTTAAPIPILYYEKYGSQQFVSLPDDHMENWQPILPGGEITRMVGFTIEWKDAKPPRNGSPKSMCPYIGVHVTYALGDGTRGETAATFQIGLAHPTKPRDLRGFQSDHERRLGPLRINEGVRGKIT